jgi:hypothetical protein
MFHFLQMIILTIAATMPSTAPSTQPAMETLWDGRIHFDAPDGWVLTGKTADGLQAHYRSGDHLNSISIVVNVEDVVISDAMAHQLAAQIIKKIKDEAQRTGTQLLIGPRIEHDDRFLLCIHDRWRGSENSGDRMQIYKQKGLALVLVVSLALTEDPQEAKPIHAEAANLLENIVLTRGTPKPVTRPARRSGR